MGFLKKWKEWFGNRGKTPEPVYQVLLFGETGWGKSTLINYLTNFFRGGNVEKLLVAIPNKFYTATEEFKSQENDIRDVTKSKTVNCTVYEFEMDRVKFRFIDTPGLSDTDGVEKDDLNIKNIMDAAEKAGKLAAIVIVINGTVGRTTVNMRATLARMSGSLPDVLLKNLLVVLTNCTVTGYNFELKSLPWKVPDDNVYVMNNSALSRDPVEWIENPKMVNAMKMKWKNSMDEIEKMILRLSELGSEATDAFKEMRKNREHIKAELHEIILEIKKLQALQSELESSVIAKKGATQDVKRYSNFKSTREVEYDILVPSTYHSTLCMTHTDRVCHDHYGLQYTEQSNATLFTGCACMSGTKCHVCECGFEQHYHAMKMPEKAKKTVQNIMQDVKDQFDMSSKKWNFWQNKVTTLKEDLKGITAALKSKQKKIDESCRKLKILCSGFNFANELKSVIDTLEANARTLTTVNARVEADKMIKHIKVLADRSNENHTTDNRNTVSDDSEEDPEDQYDDVKAASEDGEDQSDYEDAEENAAEDDDENYKPEDALERTGTIGKCFEPPAGMLEQPQVPTPGVPPSVANASGEGYPLGEVSKLFKKLLDKRFESPNLPESGREVLLAAAKSLRDLNKLFITEKAHAIIHSVESESVQQLAARIAMANQQGDICKVSRELKAKVQTLLVLLGCDHQSITNLAYACNVDFGKLQSTVGQCYPSQETKKYLNMMDAEIAGNGSGGLLSMVGTLFNAVVDPTRIQTMMRSSVVSALKDIRCAALAVNELCLSIVVLHIQRAEAS